MLPLVALPTQMLSTTREFWITSIPEAPFPFAVHPLIVHVPWALMPTLPLSIDVQAVMVELSNTVIPSTALNATLQPLMVQMDWTSIPKVLDLTVQARMVTAS